MRAHRNVQEAGNPSLYGRRCRLQVCLPAAMHHAQGCNWSMLSCRVRHVDHITSNVHALCCYTLTCTLAQLRVGNAHTQAAHDCCQTRCHSTVTLHRTTIMRYHIACLSEGCQRCAAHSGSTNHRAVTSTVLRNLKHSCIFQSFDAWQSVLAIVQPYRGQPPKARGLSATPALTSKTPRACTAADTNVTHIVGR